MGFFPSVSTALVRWRLNTFSRRRRSWGAPNIKKYWMRRKPWRGASRSRRLAHRSHCRTAARRRRRLRNQLRLFFLFFSLALSFLGRVPSFSVQKECQQKSLKKPRARRKKKEMKYPNIPTQPTMRESLFLLTLSLIDLTPPPVHAMPRARDRIPAGARAAPCGTWRLRRRD